MRPRTMAPARHSKPALFALALASCVASAVGCERAVTYAVIRNGGVGPRRAACNEGAIGLAETLSLTLRDATGCADGRAHRPDDGATYAYVQPDGSDTLLGPVVSNRVEVSLVGPEGPNVTAVPTSNSAASGTIVADANPDVSVEPSRARALVSLRKSASVGTVLLGDEIEYRINLELLSDTRIRRLIVVDRVDAVLEVVHAEGARALRLEDASVALVWDLRSLRSRRGERVELRFVAAARGQRSAGPLR